MARGAAADGLAACGLVRDCGVVADGPAAAAWAAGGMPGDWVALPAAGLVVGDTLAFGGTRVAVGGLGACVGLGADVGASVGT